MYIHSPSTAAKGPKEIITIAARWPAPHAHRSAAPQAAPARRGRPARARQPAGRATTRTLRHVYAANARRPFSRRPERGRLLRPKASCPLKGASRQPAGSSEQVRPVVRRGLRRLRCGQAVAALAQAARDVERQLKRLLRVQPRVAVRVVAAVQVVLTDLRGNGGGASSA